MSKDSKHYTIQFSRMEIEWLQRHIISGRDKAEGMIKSLSEPAGKILTPEESKNLTDITVHRNDLNKFIQHLGDTLVHHDRKRLELAAIKEELQEAIEICDEPEARKAAKEELAKLPDSPPINITFDRNTLKFTLKLIENDLHKFRSSIIPNYEKTDAAEFTDRIRTKSYYVNKSRRAKNTLERMKIKLEKGL